MGKAIESELKYFRAIMEQCKLFIDSADNLDGSLDPNQSMLDVEQLCNNYWNCEGIDIHNEKRS